MAFLWDKDWRSRMPGSVIDDIDPHGDEVRTPTDHRMLYHIEGVLAVNANTERLKQLQHDLKMYLNENCIHHWSRYSGDDHIPAHRQCMWCNYVIWEADEMTSGVSS